MIQSDGLTPFYGTFIQISNDIGIVVCDAYTLPPIALVEPVQPEGWALLADGQNPLDVNAGPDGWLEVYVYERQER